MMQMDASTAKTTVNTHSTVERLKGNIILIMVSEICYQQKIFCLPDVLLCENMPFSSWELKMTLSKQVRNNLEQTDCFESNMCRCSVNQCSETDQLGNNEAIAIKMLLPVLWWYTFKQNTDSTSFVREISWESSQNEELVCGVCATALQNWKALLNTGSFTLFYCIVQPTKASSGIFHAKPE